MHSAEENVLKGVAILRRFNIQTLDIIDHLNILNVITYNCMYWFLRLIFLEFFRAWEPLAAMEK